MTQTSAVNRYMQAMLLIFEQTAKANKLLRQALRSSHDAHPTLRHGLYWAPCACHMVAAWSPKPAQKHNCFKQTASERFPQLQQPSRTELFLLSLLFGRGLPSMHKLPLPYYHDWVLAVLPPLHNYEHGLVPTTRHTLSRSERWTTPLPATQA